MIRRDESDLAARKKRTKKGKVEGGAPHLFRNQSTTRGGGGGGGWQILALRSLFLFLGESGTGDIPRGGGRKGGWSKRSSSSFPASTMDLQLCKQKREKRGRGEVFMAGSSSCVFLPSLFVWGFGVCVGYYFHLQTSTKRATMSLAPVVLYSRL